MSSVEVHVASCDACMNLVAEVGAALAGQEPHAPGDAGLAEPPLLVRGVRVGRHVIERPVGAGGMGRVYAAHDPALDRQIALELLHRYATAPELEARLLREAQAMARLAHPEVITVHDVGRFGERLFIAMEFVDGGTLRQWLAEEPRSWRLVLDVFVRAGRGLASAHAAGIIHRDFKPDNVLVGADGRVRVTDFGLAQTARDVPGGTDSGGGALGICTTQYAGSSQVGKYIASQGLCDFPFGASEVATATQFMVFESTQE